MFRRLLIFASLFCFRGRVFGSEANNSAPATVRILFYPVTSTQELHATTPKSCDENVQPLTAAACFQLNECLPYFDAKGAAIFLGFSIDQNSLQVKVHDFKCDTKTGVELKFVEGFSSENNFTLLTENTCGLPAVSLNGSLARVDQAFVRTKWKMETCDPIPSVLEESSNSGKLPSVVSNLLQKSKEKRTTESSDMTYYLHEYIGSTMCSDVESPFWAQECIPNNICLPFKDGTSIKITAREDGLKVKVYFMGGCNSFLQIASVDFHTSEGTIAAEDQCANTIMLDGAVVRPYKEALSIKYSFANCPTVSFSASNFGIKIPESVNDLLTNAHVTTTAKLLTIFLVVAVSLTVGAVTSLWWVKKNGARYSDYHTVPQYQVRYYDAMEATSVPQIQKSFPIQTASYQQDL